MAAAMKLGILGPLYIADAAGQLRNPPAFKLRALLAQLLVEHNRVVSTERLMDGLWAGAPPKTARTAMQVYVCSLRKLLEEAHLPTDVVNIVTCPPGYMIKVDEQEFDVPCFERRLRDSRQAHDRGDYRAASELISGALELWRGPALYDVGCITTLAAEARRLDELRTVAREWRVCIDLELGLDGDLVSELYTLTTEHPLRERLWEYLMIALHNQGRPAEALQAYNTARMTMLDQLGLETGTTLRELQQVVLARGPMIKIHPTYLANFIGQNEMGFRRYA
jgi:DNA-binding SARP family transcriptional activator